MIKKMNITHEDMYKIVELVKNGKVPDGTYNDDACVLWEVMRSLVRETGGNLPDFHRMNVHLSI